MKTLALIALYALAATHTQPSENEAPADTALEAQIGMALTASAFVAAQQPPGQAPDHRHYAYKPSDMVSISVRTEVAHIFSKSLILDSTARAQLNAYFENSDLMGALAPEIEKYGFDVHSIATAMTIWLAANYEIIHGETTDAAQIRGLHAQMTQLLATLPDFSHGSDADKQRMAEGLYWIALLQQYVYQQAQNGMPGYSEKAVVDQAREVLAQYGFNLDNLTLGENGFIPREGYTPPAKTQDEQMSMCGVCSLLPFFHKKFFL